MTQLSQIRVNFDKNTRYDQRMATVSVIARCLNQITDLNFTLSPNLLKGVHLEIWCVKKGGQHVCERLNSGRHCLTVGQHVCASFDRSMNVERVKADSIFALDIDVTEGRRRRSVRSAIPFIPRKGAFHKKGTQHGKMSPVREESDYEYAERLLHQRNLSRTVYYKIKCNTMHERKDGWRPRRASDYPPKFRGALRCLLMLAKGRATSS
jgi:hypothetical protein